MDAQCWQDHAVNVTLDSMEGALNWIWDLNKIEPRSATATVEGIIKALADQHVSNGNRTEWSPIRSVMIRVITKSDDRVAGVRFV